MLSNKPRVVNDFMNDLLGRKDLTDMACLKL